MTPNEIRTMVASKDYGAIARAFAAEVDVLADLPGAAAERGVVKALANRLAVALKADNPKFDVVVFTKACGLDRLPR